MDENHKKIREIDVENSERTLYMGMPTLMLGLIILCRI